MPSRDPSWLSNARKDLGQREVRGASRHNPFILRLWTSIRAPFTDDETPWCAGFVGAKLEEVGIRSTRSAWARSYMNWGVELRQPVLGCIVVFTRGVSSGHVAFYVGTDARGNIIVLGGNQGNKVSIATYPSSRLLGYRWPEGVDVPGSTPVGLIGGTAPMADEPEPSMVTSKTGAATIVAGASGLGEALRSGNEIAYEVANAKMSADAIGVWAIWEALLNNPRFAIALVVVIACIFIWVQHRRYKKALLRAQHGTPTVPGA